MSLLVRCPDFMGGNVHKQGVWDGQMCPVYRGVLISGCPDLTAITLSDKPYGLSQYQHAFRGRDVHK